MSSQVIDCVYRLIAGGGPIACALPWETTDRWRGRSARSRPKIQGFMMIKQKFLGYTPFRAIVAGLGMSCLCSLHAAPISGQGTWESTLQARDLDGNLSTVEAYYDTQLGITWMANANLAKSLLPTASATPTTSTDGSPTVTLVWSGDPDYSMVVDGLMRPAQAAAWAQAMNFHGVTGWRLPFNLVANDSPLTEITHLYSSTLGNTLRSRSMQLVNKGGFGVTQYVMVDTIIRAGGTGNTGPFLNLASPLSATRTFWASHSEDPDASFGIGAFDWGTGYVATQSATSKAIAWLVHDGDIGNSMAVPEPQTLLLMLLGLSVLGIRRSYGNGR